MGVNGEDSRTFEEMAKPFEGKPTSLEAWRERKITPKQELLVERIRKYLPAAWWLGVGISFSFLSGEVRPAPKWMKAVGLEWFHRLGQEPRRLSKRYLLHGLPFAAKLFLWALRGRLRKRQAPSK